MTPSKPGAEHPLVSKPLLQVLRSILSLVALHTLLILGSHPAYAAEPSLSFSPASIETAIGEPFTVDIILDTAGYIAHGTGAKMSFDPHVLEVVSIQTGTIFGDYPTASMDNVAGRVIISGIVSSRTQYFRGKDVFASVTFQGTSPGSTVVSFLYEPGSTTDSNIAVTYGTGDILAKVGTLTVTVQDTGERGGFGTEQLTPTPSPTPTSLFGRLLQSLGFTTQIDPTSIRESRTLNEALDPHAPIPSQPPITDPNQAQSPSALPPTIVHPVVKALRTILFLVATVIATLFGERLYRSWKKKRQKPTDGENTQNRSTPQ